MFKKREIEGKENERGDISKVNGEKIKPLRNIVSFSSSDKKEIDPKYEQEQPPVAYAMAVVQEMIKKNNPACLSDVGTKLPKRENWPYSYWGIEEPRPELRERYLMGMEMLR